ncbi:MAG: SprT family zinc-dependent metalloprotease [Simkaniaceae bacterium]|nr:SprT family zinc-dependent metalloprotease [Simkaniaceae bacterium]
MKRSVTLGGITVDLIRKDIKGTYFRVYPDGRVALSVPRDACTASIERAMSGKREWILRKREEFGRCGGKGPSGPAEGIVPFAGKSYRLKIAEGEGHRTVLLHDGVMELRVSPNSSRRERKEVLLSWYDKRLRRAIMPLIDKWEPVLRVHVLSWDIKHMKTLWGSCNYGTRHIRFNLELVKVRVECLEYIVLHEMVHLLERHHGDAFRGYMDRFMPCWRTYSRELNRSHYEGSGCPMTRLEGGGCDLSP